MHTISVSIPGKVSVVESAEVNDADALPLFIRLKAVLQAEGVATPARRRGRPRKERPVGEEISLPQESEAAEPSEA